MTTSPYKRKVSTLQSGVNGLMVHLPVNMANSIGKRLMNQKNGVVFNETIEDSHVIKAEEPEEKAASAKTAASRRRSSVKEEPEELV